tara:strand:- start:852 stop:1055 length:204 start_codon:yes stop_codon:yes gene_type:complete
MKLLLDLLVSMTAHAGDQIALGEIEGVAAQRITLDELNRLNHMIGDLHQLSRTLRDRIRYVPEGDDQ